MEGANGMNDGMTEQYNAFKGSLAAGEAQLIRDQQKKKNLRLVFIALGVLLIVLIMIFVIWKLSMRRENTLALQLYAELQDNMSMGWLEQKVGEIDKNAEVEVDYFGDGVVKIGQDEYIMFSCGAENDNSGSTDDNIVEEGELGDEVEEDANLDDELSSEILEDDEEEWNVPELELNGSYLPSDLAYGFTYMRDTDECQYYITEIEDGQFLLSSCDEAKTFSTKEGAIGAYLAGR